MSRSTIVLAALLGCVVLVAVWLGSGDDTSAPSEVKEEVARAKPASKPAFGNAQHPPRVFDRPGARRDAEEKAQPEESEPGGEVVMKNRVEPRVGMNQGTRAERRAQREANMEARRSQQGRRGQHAGVLRQGGGPGRRDPENPQPEMGKAEQPPLRQPNDVDDEDDLNHLRDVALSDPDPDERADAVSQLDLDDPAALDVLIKALEDSDSDVRLAALDELWTNSDDPPLDILQRVVNDPDPEVRLEAVRILSESDEPYAIQLLRGALTDADEEVRDEAKEALDLD